MKRILSVFAFSAMLIWVAAQAADPPEIAPAPAPPGLNDPGVKPTDVPSAEARDARGQAPVDDVQIRKQGEDTIEEYRRGGKLTMVRITPKNGVPQTYMADDRGRLRNDPKSGPIDPVYFTLYQWN